MKYANAIPYPLLKVTLINVYECGFSSFQNAKIQKYDRRRSSPAGLWISRLEEKCILLRSLTTSKDLNGGPHTTLLRSLFKRHATSLA